MSAVLNLLDSLLVANINMVVNNGVGAPCVIIACAVISSTLSPPTSPLSSPLPSLTPSNPP